MPNIQNILTDNIDIWTSSIEQKSSAGRGKNNKIRLHGTQKLRELILELAIRGKLVPQDPNDEPASVLLEKIEAEKEQLIKEGAIKKQKPLPQISEEETSFRIKQGWEWVRLGRLTQRISNGYSGKQNKNEDGYPLSRIETISNSSVNMEKVGYSPDIDPEKLDYYRLKPGDILLSHINSDFHVGKTAIVPADVELYHGTNLLLLRLFPNILPTYVDLNINTLRLSGYFIKIAQHAIGQSSINQPKVLKTCIALPPIAEQQRIIAKVDELMALCDQLEKQTEESIEAHQVLVTALLATLTQSQDAEELSQNWTRISDHFETLFTTDHSIDQLKQTILQLAVMGKLVPQDPNDEPASVLLEKIEAEKTRLVKNGQIKKHKPLPKVNDEEKPFKLPKGWEWTHLPTVGELARGKSKHRPRNAPILYKGGTIPLVQTGDVARSDSVITTYTALYNERGLEQSRLWPKGTLCITIAANIADTGVLGFDACFPDSVVGFIPFDNTMENRYFDYFIRTAKNNLEEFAPSTAQKNINLEILGKLLVPLPPKGELNIIVAKVDELMSLCDQLKERLSDAQSIQNNLAAAIVEKAVA